MDFVFFFSARICVKRCRVRFCEFHERKLSARYVSKCILNEMFQRQKDTKAIMPPCIEQFKEWFVATVMLTESNLILRCSDYQWNVSVSSVASKRNQHRYERWQLVGGPQLFSYQVLPDRSYTLQKKVSTMETRQQLHSEILTCIILDNYARFMRPHKTSFHLPAINIVCSVEVSIFKIIWIPNACNGMKIWLIIVIILTT